MLTVNADIESVAEPWILLPFVYPLRNEGVYSEYSHLHLRAALADFLDELPNGEDDYLEAVGGAVRELYGKAAPGVRFFLDKTPRYTLICDKIIKMFPDAKIIFLWRNPLAVISSLIDTFGKGQWNLYQYKVDLYDGLANAIQTYNSSPDRFLSVKYESLVKDPEGELRRICEYLGLEDDPEMINSFSRVSYRGNMGDPSGTKLYSSVNTSSLDKWKTSPASYYKKFWCSRYVDWLGSDRLKIMGYDLGGLKQEIKDQPSQWGSGLFLDVFIAAYSRLFFSKQPTEIERDFWHKPRWFRRRKP